MHRASTNTLVGQRIAAIRTERHMSQAELASRLSTELGRNVDPSAVTRMEGGKRPISVAEIVAVAAVLEVRPADLLPEGAPLQSWLLRWTNVHANRAHDVLAAHKALETAIEQAASAQARVDAFQTLVKMKRTGRVTAEAVAAIELAGQAFNAPEDLFAVLEDAGVSKSVLDESMRETDEVLAAGGEPATGWARSAFVAASVAKRLSRDATT